MMKALIGEYGMIKGKRIYYALENKRKRRR